MRSLERRLAELERRLGAHRITLRMADGSTRMVSSWRWLDMLHELGQNILKADTQAVIDSVDDDCFESGNGHMTELVKVLAAAHIAQLDSAQIAALDATE